MGFFVWELVKIVLTVAMLLRGSLGDLRSGKALVAGHVRPRSDVGQARELARPAQLEG